MCWTVVAVYLPPGIDPVCAVGVGAACVVRGWGPCGVWVVRRSSVLFKAHAHLPLGPGVRLNGPPLAAEA